MTYRTFPDLASAQAANSQVAQWLQQNQGSHCSGWSDLFCNASTGLYGLIYDGLLDTVLGPGTIDSDPIDGSASSWSSYVPPPPPAP